jgi:hypothetical protein
MLMPKKPGSTKVPRCPDCGDLCVPLTLHRNVKTVKLYCAGKCNEKTNDVSKWKYVIEAVCPIRC